VPSGYTLTYRVRLDPRALLDGTTAGGGLGRWVFHCHIFFHATFGMISEFVVTDPDGKERPYVNATDTLIDANTGDGVAMNGTVVDTDGDAVTLTASIGSVVDNGDGTWTWSCDRGRDGGSYTSRPPTRVAAGSGGLQAESQLAAGRHGVERVGR
jgi:hypothetical protein